MGAMRVVSLVPSLTELVWALAPGVLVGRTKFCDEPAEMAAAVPAFGGTKDPDVAAIAAAAPDLVIANHEENRREDVEALRARGIRVLVTEIDSVAEAFAAIRALGEELGAEERAEAIVQEAADALAEPPAAPPVRVFVPIWRRPLLGLGGNTYGSSMLEACGAVNVLAGRPRYPEVSPGEVAALRPDLVLLPDEPYRFSADHVAEFAGIAPARVVDGRLLWWYGPRMAASVRALKALFREVRG
jgi:ABC-type Fe3+-hydroxamate transport system substrate-binding protein